MNESSSSFALSTRLRMLVLALVAGVGFGLAACAAAFGPGRIEIPERDLQAIVAKPFPIVQRWLDVLEVSVGVPRLTLRPDANRLATDFEIEARDRISGRRLVGSVQLTSGLRFESVDATVRLADVRVESMRIEGANRDQQRALEAIGAPIAERWLEDRIVHAFDARQVGLARASGLVPGAIRVTPRGLSVELVAGSLGGSR